MYFYFIPQGTKRIVKSISQRAERQSLRLLKTLDHFYHSFYTISKGAEILGKMLK